jgi:ribosomal protein L37AE/L43A
MDTTCPTNDSTTMATKKQTLTFKLNYTVTKHYELKEKYDFEEFKGRFFCEDNESIKYAQAVWDRLQALGKKGVVRLDDEEEDEGEDVDDEDYYGERVGESADDHISGILKEMQKKDRHQCDECGSYYPRSELKEDNTTFDKVAWWCKQCTSSWPKKEDPEALRKKMIDRYCSGTL